MRLATGAAIIVDVNLHERETFLRRVASGGLPVSVAFDVDAEDIAALTRVGAAALAGGRHELAERVFAGLVALAPHERVHSLHLAATRHAAGNAKGALDAVNDALADQIAVDARVAELAVVQPLAREEHIDALLLRAELRGRSDPDAALADLARARSLNADARLASNASAKDRPR